MRRSSFAAALFFIALGAVLAFAVQSHAKDFNINLAGLIIMLAGVADLGVRAVIGDDPLLSPQTAQVAAVVEPLGDPVLDAFGRPVVVDPEAGLPEPTRILPAAVVEQPAVRRFPNPPAQPPIGPVAPTGIAVRPDQVLRTPGDYSVSEDVVPVSPFTGRRMHPRTWRRR